MSRATSCQLRAADELAQAPYSGAGDDRPQPPAAEADPGAWPGAGQLGR